MLQPLFLATSLASLPLVFAVCTYFSPPVILESSNLSPNDASFILSRHLGLEMFETLESMSHIGLGEEVFVGQGYRSALLLAIEEAEAKDVLPSSLSPTFKVPLPDAHPEKLVFSVLSTCVRRAQHSYASVFSNPDYSLSSPSESSAYNFIDRIHSLSHFLDTQGQLSFAAMDLSYLTHLRMTFGSHSHEYTSAAAAVRSLIHGAVALPEDLHVAILTYKSSTHMKREADPQQSQSPLPPYHPAPQEPIGSISTCFGTADTCINGTSSCSGRGKCVQASKAGRTCFVCACGVTKTGKGANMKTETWVGESCERKDISGPFVLLSGTVIVIILLLVGSVSLLYAVGNQEFPSTLMGGAVSIKRE